MMITTIHSRSNYYIIVMTIKLIMKTITRIKLIRIISLIIIMMIGIIVIIILYN